MKGGGLSTKLGEILELLQESPGSPLGVVSTALDPSRWCQEQQKWQILGWPGHLLELFEEGHSGLGTLQSELFNGIVLAAGAAPIRILVVQDVQSCFPFF